jgi:diaminohydroxyphosphoribosylaminopyrimidine deaminase/5-amino-6-(5-phosphoribosylamino)uracil reductase
MVDFSMQDAHWMARAIRLAERGLFSVRPNPAVGCVIVRDGQCVGEGWHQKAGEPHAEVYALRAAGGLSRGATAYVTLEPCSHYGRTSPCCEALIAAGVARVVVAMQDPNPQVAGRGLARLRNAGIEVSVGLMAESARALNLGFLSRMERQRPYIRVKIAASLDGRTALNNGQSQWITGESARADVHRLRARSGAVVTGIETVLADDPLLTVRLAGYEQWQPLRVLLDSRLRISLDAKLLAQPAQLLIAFDAGLMDELADKIAVLGHLGVRLLPLPRHESGLDLPLLLHHLAIQEHINDLMVEAGANLAGAFIAQGLADELWWYQTALLMGHSARAALMMPEVITMAEVARWYLSEQRPIGTDWRIILKAPLKT